MSSNDLGRDAVEAALQGRDDARRGRRTNLSGNNQPYAVNAPSEFSLERFAKAGSLRSVYRILKASGGPAPGPDGITFSDLSQNDEWKLASELNRCLVDRSYRPGATRRVRIRKPDGRFRTLNLADVHDRLVAKALLLAIESHWRGVLPDHWSSPFRVFAQMETFMRENGAYVVAIDDVRDCFPSAPIDRVVECQQNHFGESDLFWLAETIIRGQEGSRRQTGLDQGSPYSPVAMELLLHDCLDQQTDFNGQGPTRLFRYVDNVNIVCRSVCEGRAALQSCRENLRAVALTLKGTDGEPTDLRDSEATVNVLGLHLGWNDGQMTITVPESSFRNLEETLITATLLPGSLRTARRVINGWLLSGVAPALTRTQAPIIIGRVSSIARRLGFTEIRENELTRTARKALDVWMDVRNECSSTPVSLPVLS